MTNWQSIDFDTLEKLQRACRLQTLLTVWMNIAFVIMPLPSTYSHRSGLCAYAYLFSILWNRNASYITFIACAYSPSAW